jgi:hypothetical protein
MRSFQFGAHPFDEPLLTSPALHQRRAAMLAACKLCLLNLGEALRVQHPNLRHPQWQVVSRQPKTTQGQHHHGLPYTVLDYPFWRQGNAQLAFGRVVWLLGDSLSFHWVQAPAAARVRAPGARYWEATSLNKCDWRMPQGAAGPKPLAAKSQGPDAPVGVYSKWLPPKAGFSGSEVILSEWEAFFKPFGVLP